MTTLNKKTLSFIYDLGHLNVRQDLDFDYLDWKYYQGKGQLKTISKTRINPFSELKNEDNLMLNYRITALQMSVW